MDTGPEQRLLKLSIALTLAVGAIGVVCGLLVHSQAIVFDGMYSLVDMVLTGASLAVSRLVALEGSHRFQYGYWHLEPLVEVFGGAILALACVYALINAVNGLIGGGHEVAFGFGAAWAGILSVVGLAMALLMRRHAKRMQSGLLALDSRTWLVSGLLSLALLIGFGLAMAIEGTQLARWIPYLDSIILLCIALAMLPVPMFSTWRAAREVLQVAPIELDDTVKSAIRDVVAQHGFLDFNSHVAKVGRARFVEVHILAPAHHGLTLDGADRIRRDIAHRLGANTPQFWLTVDFTGDPTWI
jgi:cation diffusion facilitator family transporter